MDLFPAPPGHILVLPRQHIENIHLMSVDSGARIMATTITVAKAIKQQLSRDGLNLIQSNQLAAGQTIPHFHPHIAPRYGGEQVFLRFDHGDVPAKFADPKHLASLVVSVLAGNNPWTK
jgi:histidine triad (HIT) family protein